GAETASHVGRANFGVKWRFADEKETGVSLATYPQVLFRLQSGTGEERTSFFLPLIVQKDLGLLSANLEAGYEWRSGGAPGLWLGGLALGRELSDRVEVIGEVFTESPSDFASAEVAWNLGGRWKLGPALVLLFSGGTGFKGSGESPRVRAQGYLGMH